MSERIYKIGDVVRIRRGQGGLYLGTVTHVKIDYGFPPLLTVHIRAYESNDGRLEKLPPGHTDVMTLLSNSQLIAASDSASGNVRWSDSMRN